MSRSYGDMYYRNYAVGKQDTSLLATLASINPVQPELDVLLSENLGYHSTMDSPILKTPLLEQDTPLSAHTPLFMSTPLYRHDTYMNEICVANYFDTFPLTDKPSVEFNGDPSQLLIDKSKAGSVHYQPHQSDSFFHSLSSVSQSLIDYNESDDENISVFDKLGEIAYEDTQDQCQPTESQKQENDESENAPQEADDLSFATDSSQLTSRHCGSQRRSLKRKQREDGDEESSEPEQKMPRNKSVKKPYQCDICKARFSRRYNLTTHVKTHDKQRIKEHGCTFCDKAFDRKHDRDRHVATVHHNKRTFTCKICPTSFTRRDALSRHRLVRHNEDPDQLP
ncbi:hypothetical protein J3Q64DRAFT_1715440 [Phycomyces blakesleeanus]|uniref:C2H2-type domain-containing protein n=2 Tax=Phycomyces blakesleeanus TaxID=4837 RepID=A0ABR3BG52_PHYBL